MTTEALVASIRRHVPLLRSDPEFINYILNLALYLLEQRDSKAALPEPRQGDPAQVTPTTRALLEGAAKPPESNTCHICGSPTEGKRVCPHCGHMAT
jgi:Ribosomal L32p protein family